MTADGDVRPVRRIAVVDRGEPAMRLINAARERSLETGETITTIALYTEPDRRSRFVREADEAWCVGPAASTSDGTHDDVDPVDGDRRPISVDLGRLERALVRTSADAAWIGWGSTAEHLRLADLCDRLGLTFVGPSAEDLRRLVDGPDLTRIAEGAGLPVAAADTATDAATDFSGTRHVEVQIVADADGTVWPVGAADRSVRRGEQALLVEAPSPALDQDLRGRILDAAARAGRAAGLRNAATVSFLVRPDDASVSLVGLESGLSVDHPVIESTTGVDLVKLQLHLASGGRLAGPAPDPVGHAVGACVCAEDPEQAFAPAIGRIDVLRFPTGPGLRIDTGVEEGDEIPPGSGSRIATLTAVGRDRAEATARLRRALEQTEIVVRDGTSDPAFLHELLARPEWRSGEMDAAWVERFTAAGGTTSRLGEIALLAAAIDAHRAGRAVEIAAFRATAARGRPEIDDRLSRTIELRHRGRTHRMDIRRLGPGDYRITVGGHRIAVHREEVGRARTVLTVAGERHRVVSAVHGVTHYVDVDGQPHRIVHDEGGSIRSPAPAVVASLSVEVGDRVEVGERLAVIEAMKMETVLVAEFAGVVRSIDVRHNDQVGAGARLMVVEPDRDSPMATPAGAPELSFADLAVRDEADHDHCAHWLHAIRQMLLGYDLEPADIEALGRSAGAPCGGAIGDAEHLRIEHEVLEIFGDVVSLFGREADESDEPLLRHGTEGYLFEYLRRVEDMAADFPASFVARLRRTLSHFGIDRLDPNPDLDTALARIVRSHQRMNQQIGPVITLLGRRLQHPATVTGAAADRRRALLDDVARVSRADHPAVHDLAREVIYREFDAPFFAERRWQLLEEAESHLDALEAVEDPGERAVHVDALVDSPQPLRTLLSRRFVEGSSRVRAGLLEVMTRRYYRIRDLGDVVAHQIDGVTVVTASYERDGRTVHVAAMHVEREELRHGARVIDGLVERFDGDDVDVVLDVYLWSPVPVDDDRSILDEVGSTLDDVLGSRRLHRIAVAVTDPTSDAAALAGRAMRSRTHHLTLRPTDDGHYAAQPLSRDLHPMMAKRLELWRLDNFDVTRVDSPDDVYLYHGTARENRRDERLFAIAEVRDLTAIRDDSGRLVRLPELERIVHEVAGSIRRFQAQRPPGRRLEWNRILLSVWPQLDLTGDEIAEMVARLAPDVEGLGLQKVQVLARIALPSGEIGLRVLELTDPAGNDPQVQIRETSTQRIRPLGRHEQNVVRLRQRGLVDPYALLRMLTPRGPSARRGIPPGEFQEYDLVGDPAPDDPDATPTLVPVDREPGLNTANIVVAVVTNRTERYPEGMRRVAIVGDPSRGMGNLAEAECRRINAALDLAEELGVPADWFAVSAGAKIAMDSGSENMDWISATLRRIIEFTQAGRHLNVVVTGISVGAQPYWNAEATMLMHTKGVLIMVPTSAMVLTGKDALDYSGGVSAENNLGIGGYERVMGPNGQAQYLAHDVADACALLLRHHEFTWSEPGERFPRRSATTDPVDRDIRAMPHGGEFPTLAELFSETTNPGRKKPFEMRRVMEAVVDQDVEPMERWFGMADAEIPIVWNASIGGHRVCLLGFEAQNLPRPGVVPADGPTRWTSSTLFPKGSKKVARAINATSGNRPLVVLASLSGFDGSPESMRTWQLEFGAEIGRAVVNFDGPIVFCVVSRYHGGAFVVFSGALNDQMEVAALEGSHASVIGGAPAAAVVFAREVGQRTDADPRVAELRDAVASAAAGDRARLTEELAAVREQVHADKLGEVAAEFDGIHDVNRALAVGSIDRIIPPAELRPYLVDAIERGIERALAGHDSGRR